MNVPNHDGSRRDALDQFWSPPDPAIGALRSASTSDNVRRPLVPARNVKLMRIVFGVVGFILFAPFGILIHPLAMLLTGAVGAALGAYLTRRPTQRCSYVGEVGF